MQAIRDMSAHEIAVALQLYRLSDDPGDAVAWIVDLVDGERDPDEHPAGERRIRECYHRPTDEDLVLTVIDSIIGTHGVEALAYGEDSDDAADAGVVEYCNAGDGYTPTVIWLDGVYYVGCWADLT